MAVIRLPRTPSVWEEMAPYVMQYAQMKMGQRIRTEERLAEQEEKKRQESFIPEIPENLKGRIALIQTSPGKWQAINLEQQKKALKAYMGPKGDVIYRQNNVAPPEGYKPYSKGTATGAFKVGALKEFKHGDSYYGAVYEGGDRKYLDYLPKGWRPTGASGKIRQPTLSERDLVRQKAAIGKLREMDPNITYMKHGFRVNDDGTLYLDPVTDAPQKLPPFHKVMSKRGMVQAVKTLGENWEDSKQLLGLLNDPKVAQNLKLAEQEIGLWDRVSGKWNNKVALWLQKKGVGKNSKTYEAITRMQRIASQERKALLGAAITGTELESTLPWMPNAGDSLSTMLNKAGLMASEGEESFRYWLNIYKDVANMGPFYEAFGLKIFSDEPRQSIENTIPQKEVPQPEIPQQNNFLTEEAKEFLRGLNNGRY